MKKNVSTGVGNIFLVCSSIVVFLLLIFRSNGIYPVVMGDEYLSSLFSRLLPLSDIARRPGFLYSLIYRITNVCGDGFLEGARMLNALFFVATSPFIYLTARRVCTKNVAVIVTLMALLGPINSYTAYFMPESLYFLSFWILTWFILRLDSLSAAKSWCLGGVLLGLLSLIKPHALFLLPAMVVCIIFFSRKKEGKWIQQAAWKAGIFVTCTFLIKLLIGYALADRAGITLFGTEYTAIAKSPGSNFQRYVELFALAAGNIKGHLLAICLLFGLPIAGALISVFNPATPEEDAKATQNISLYTLAVLFSLIAVTGLYTAWVERYESVARLHMRYYNFAFPLLLVIAAVSLVSTASKLRWRMIAALPIGTGILYAAYTCMAPYTPNVVDSPELRGFTGDPTVFYILCGLAFAALAVWVFAARTGAKFFIYLFIPFAVILSAFYVNRDIRQRLVPDAFDRAGIFAKQYLPDTERSKVVIAGSNIFGLLRSLFHLDNPNAEMQKISQGDVYDLSKIPVGKEWVLVVGDHPFLGKPYFQLSLNGFTLARAIGADHIDFRTASWPGIISRASGLSRAERWGTWSDGDTVILEFVMPLPEKFTVHLVASAFGPNIGKEFTASVGDSATKFVLEAEPKEKVLEFNNPEKSRTIKIDIPAPASPKELGMSSDSRKLGVGFLELRTVPVRN